MHTQKGIIYVMYIREERRRTSCRDAAVHRQVRRRIECCYDLQKGGQMRMKGMKSASDGHVYCIA